MNWIVVALTSLIAPWLILEGGSTFTMVAGFFIFFTNYATCYYNGKTAGIKLTNEIWKGQA
jgi:hypothetical protein